jgi:cardiolipin synthase
MSAIAGAARRGVSVEVIVPPRSSHRVVGWATEHRLGRLLDAGVRVWHWTGAMLHAKTVVVDRRWSLIGSTNLDWLSLRRNAELNVEIHGSRIGDQMAEMFAADRALCRPFGLQEWRTRSRIRRVLTSACAAADVLL